MLVWPVHFLHYILGVGAVRRDPHGILPPMFRAFTINLRIFLFKSFLTFQKLEVKQFVKWIAVIFKHLEKPLTQFRRP